MYKNIVKIRANGENLMACVRDARQEEKIVASYAKMIKKMY